VAKVGMSNQDRTISLKAAVRSCIEKQHIALRDMHLIYILINILIFVLFCVIVCV